MITRFRVQNYKALRDVTLDLTPIHVLIGPNDTGKTSILEAISALCRCVDHGLADAFAGAWEGRTLVWSGSKDSVISFVVTTSAQHKEHQYELECRFSGTGRSPAIAGEWGTGQSGRIKLGTEGAGQALIYTARAGAGGLNQPQLDVACPVAESLDGVQLCRWNPQLLELPVVADSKRQYLIDATGFGLALCLDDILGRDRGRFDALENHYKRLFPDVSSIVLKRQEGYRCPPDDPKRVPLLRLGEGKGVFLKFVGSELEVPASQISDGLLLVLGYLTLLYVPKPPRVLLVEEPENGIHPKRLHDVLTILRDLVKEQSHTQVILTTHSPYVVDLFKPEEVTLCRKQKDGSISLHRLSDSKTVRDQIDVFTLGEIWTGEGDDALADQPAKQEDPAK